MLYDADSRNNGDWIHHHRVYTVSSSRTVTGHSKNDMGMMLAFREPTKRADYMTGRESKFNATMTEFSTVQRTSFSTHISEGVR